jgi:hypothetical protein
MEPGQTDIDQRITDLLEDDERMLNAIERSIRKACKINKALGVPMVVWENGEVKAIAPQNLPETE